MAFPPHLPHPGGLPQLILDSWAFLGPEVEPGEQPPIFGGKWVPGKGGDLGVTLSGFASNSATWAKRLQVSEYFPSTRYDARSIA